MFTDSPLIIAGMHRSGTSMVARVVQSMGIFIGHKLVGANATNQKGHYEDEEFVRFQRNLLGWSVCHQANGLLYPVSPGVLDWGWTSSKFADPSPDMNRIELEKLIRSRRDRIPWGWKDPRSSALVRYYMANLPYARWLVVYREPWDVCRSVLNLKFPELLQNKSWPLRIWEDYNRRLLELPKDKKVSFVHCRGASSREGIDRLRSILEESLAVKLSQPDYSLVERNMLSHMKSDHPVSIKAMRHHACWKTYLELQERADIPDPEYPNEPDILTEEIASDLLKDISGV